MLPFRKMTPPNKPVYDLAVIQSKFRARPCQGIIRQEAADGAREMGLKEQDIRQCLGSLTITSFHKSLLATHPVAAAQGLWQDAYKPEYKGNRIYMKVQLNAAGTAIIVQFKRR
jgi:hypothetical protein